MTHLRKHQYFQILEHTVEGQKKGQAWLGGGRFEQAGGIAF